MKNLSKLIILLSLSLNLSFANENNLEVVNIDTAKLVSNTTQKLIKNENIKQENIDINEKKNVYDKVLGLENNNQFQIQNSQFPEGYGIEKTEIKEDKNFDKELKKVAPWAFSSIKKALELGIITSFDDYQKNITRLEFSKMAVNVYEKIMNENIKFENVNFIDTNDEFILKAKFKKIVNGYDDGTFKPDKFITRQELAVLVMNTFRATEKSFDTNIFNIEKFNDDKYIAKWAYNDVYFAKKNNIVNGIGENIFGVENPSTREQAIVMIMRMFDYLDKENDKIEEKEEISDDLSDKIEEKEEISGDLSDKTEEKEEILDDKENKENNEESENKVETFTKSQLNGNYNNFINHKFETSISSVFTEKPSVILFVNTSLMNNLSTISNLNAIKSDYKNVDFIVIDLNSNENYSKTVLKTLNINLDIINDYNYYIKNKYDIKAYPSTYFVDKNKVIKDIQVGDLSLDFLYKNTSKLIE